MLASELRFAGDVTRVEWNASAAVAGAGFGDVEITLCETSLSQLTTSFRGNYGGNTPALIYRNSWLLVTTTGDQWFGFDCSAPFAYGGSKNLIIEMRWRGDNETTVTSWHFDTRPAFRNCAVGTYAAEQGKLGTWCSRHRLTFTAAGVAPTSLGRIKTFLK
ncbi:MAG: hypothetical protein JSU81_01300 [Candidatus Coatesbacteria bacterium]|nr:MAG: hypothetical protein JSU81_01300 [Candidatus Coatesbacteria bacterium]